MFPVLSATAELDTDSERGTQNRPLAKGCTFPYCPDQGAYNPEIFSMNDNMVEWTEVGFR